MISGNIHALLERIASAAAKVGRDPATLRLLAVSKTVPVTQIAEAYAAGQRLFGENRVQELRSKALRLPVDCEWHLIGHLQENKVRHAVQCAAWIHALDTVELIRRVSRIAGEEGRRPVVLLEVNLSGETSKFGITPDDVRAVLDAALRSPHIECRGLMTMAPFLAPETELRRIFGGLRELRNRLTAEFGVPLPELSMGMSNDFEAAIAEGATLVRIGSALFGARD